MEENQVAKLLGNNELKAVVFADENNGVVLTYDSTIYKTTNGGTDWRYINVGDSIGLFHLCHHQKCSL